jgi:hypothetical protein
VHRYEETADERTERLLEEYRHAPKEWARQIKSDGKDAGAITKLLVM